MAVRLVLLAVMASLLLIGGTALLLYRTYEVTAYPGATRIADQNLTRYTPSLVTRRTTVYRTDDSFTKVYNWYSVRFELGPEMYAQSNCILMSKARPAGVRSEEQMSVMLCDTPTGRMIFVMRSFIVRYPHW